MSKSDQIHSWHRASVARHLLDVAEPLLMGRGPERVTLAMVARAAGVSRATAYNYFRNHRGLLTQFAAYRFQQLLGALEAATARYAEEPRVQLQALLRESVVFFERYGRFFRMMLREYADTVVGSPQDQLTRQIAAGMAQYVERLTIPLHAGMRRRLFVDQEPRRMAWAIAGMVIHTVLRILQQPTPHARSKELRIMENIIFHAVLAESVRLRGGGLGRRIVTGLTVTPPRRTHG